MLFEDGSRYWQQSRLSLRNAIAWQELFLGKVPTEGLLPFDSRLEMCCRIPFEILHVSERQ